MAKRSDINFIGSTNNPLAQLVSYSLGGPASLPSAGISGGNANKEQTSTQEAGAPSQLGADISKGILSHIGKNLLTGAPMVLNPMGLLAGLALNQGTKAVLGGTLSDYLGAGIKDVAFNSLSPDSAMVLGAMAPAGYESNLAALMGQSMIGRGGYSAREAGLNAIASGANLNSSTAVGYGSGVGVGGALGQGVGSMGSANSYGQGGSYSGGGGI